MTPGEDGPQVLTASLSAAADALGATFGGGSSSVPSSGAI